MILSPAVAAACRSVAAHARDPMRDFHTDCVGFYILNAQDWLPGSSLRGVREELGYAPGDLGSLGRWGRTKTREEVAEALERIAIP